MKKLAASARFRPVNPVLMAAVLVLYFLNNRWFKAHTDGPVQYFMICHFNDLICPLFFLAYSNLLLLTVGRELRKIHWVLLFGLCSGLIWEFFAPVIKPTATADPWDLLFYLIGTGLYWCILKFITRRRPQDDQACACDQELW